jgi:flavin prenyltransferase
VSWGSRVGGVNLGHRSCDAPHFFRAFFRRSDVSGNNAILRDVSPQRLIVAITGATGAIYGVRLLERLREAAVETHLVISPWGRRTLIHETACTVDQIQRLATVTYAPNDQGAAISSGSFVTMGMAIVPCSMRTLASVAHGLGDNLIHRAADVVLKERRKLLLAPREAPLNDIHLENMLKLSRMGVIICPPMPGFYQRPETIDEIVTHSVVRMLDQFGVHVDGPGRWGEEFALGITGKIPPDDSESY